MMDHYQLQKMIDAQPEAKLKDLVMQLLYDEIISLKLSPGTRLNVNQIASILGISRSHCGPGGERFRGKPAGAGGKLRSGTESAGYDQPLSGP